MKQLKLKTTTENKTPEEEVIEIANQYKNQGIPLNDLLTLAEKSYIEINNRLPIYKKPEKRASMCMWFVRQKILEALNIKK